MRFSIRSRVSIALSLLIIVSGALALLITTRPAVHAAGQASTPSSNITARPLVQRNWPQYNFDASHTGNNPYEKVLTPSNVSSLVLDWSYSAGSLGGFTSPPTVANGMLYVYGPNYTLYALDAATGTLKWSYYTGTAANTAPAVANGMVYAAGLGISALDAMTGTLKWSFSVSNALINASPTIAGSLLYVNTAVGLYALDAMTGAIKWSYARTLSSTSSSPAVANGVVYVGLYDTGEADNMYAFDALTGALKWHYVTGFSNCCISSATVANGVVYFGVVDYTTAENTRGMLFALDAATGTLKWSKTVDCSEFEAPVIANGILYLGTVNPKKLEAFDALTGKLKWGYRAGSSISFSPAVANGVVYFTSGNNTTYALEATTGTLKWSYPAGYGSPIIVNGIVYIGYDKLYAFHLPSTTP